MIHSTCDVTYFCTLPPVPGEATRGPGMKFFCKWCTWFQMSQQRLQGTFLCEYSPFFALPQNTKAATSVALAPGHMYWILQNVHVFLLVSIQSCLWECNDRISRKNRYMWLNSPLSQVYLFQFCCVDTSQRVSWSLAAFLCNKYCSLYSADKWTSLLIDFWKKNLLWFMK